MFDSILYFDLRYKTTTMKKGLSIEGSSSGGTIPYYCQVYSTLQVWSEQNMIYETRSDIGGKFC